MTSLSEFTGTPLYGVLLFLAPVATPILGASVRHHPQGDVGRRPGLESPTPRVQVKHEVNPLSP